MLSPASLRVCCLAVMAPALTKADRQAGCLPVVLSDSFCVPKSPDTYNIKGRISESRFKCAYTCESNHSNKRKPFMHRACWRTQKSGTAFICRYRTAGYDSSKSLLYASRVRTQREARFKTWQSTKATTAYAGKIKLKYTMNKNTSNIRNMGLAKANTSLGLQSMRKMKRFSKENQSSGPIHVMEDSLNYSDSADSPVQIEPLITNMNSDSDVSPVDNTVPCVSNNGRTSEQGILHTVTDTVDEKAVSESVLENDSEPFPLSAGADTIEAMDTSNASVTLTDLLNSTFENFASTKNVPSTSGSTLTCPVLNNDTAVSSVNTEEATDVQESPIVLQPPTSDSAVEASQPLKSTELPLESDVIPLQPLISKQTSDSVFTNCLGKLPFLNSFSGSLVKASSLFSVFNSSKLSTNASKLSHLCDMPVKCPVVADSRFGTKHPIPVRQEKSACCLTSSQELESLESALVDKSTVVNSCVSSSTRLLQKQLIAHIRKQMCSLVEYYQRNFEVSCQRPAKQVSSKPSKDIIDLKAELLQNEDVKNMSTAALVNLVRKLESSGSQSGAPTLETTVSGSVAPDKSEVSTTSCFDPDDCVDIKYTSSVLLSALKSVLKSSDPYLTDTSDTDTDSETDEETASETETTDEASALWNYMIKRTKLGSRSTWLLARVHELEFRIKEYNERWNELVKTEGNVCFEEPATSQNLTSILESDEADYSVKQTILKNFVLPLNGFLDHSDVPHMVKSTSEIVRESEDNEMSTKPDIEACCRVRPLDVGAFRKRKIVFMHGLHSTNPKFPRMSTVNCVCNSQSDLAPCILCTGQYHSTQSVDPELMALRDRVSILDSYFHPALSTESDIPIGLHMENILKTEAKYQYVRPFSPEPNIESDDVQQEIKPKYSDLRSHRKLSRYARTLSAKYRNKHRRNTRHLRKHKLVFGKWRRLHNKHTLRARNRFRRHSIVSSGSSPDSPVHSPSSIFDDGLGYEKRRDYGQFDIDDVIIPCNTKSGRLVEIQYKEITIPSWRTADEDIVMDTEECDIDYVKDIPEILQKRHEVLEIEEKEKNKHRPPGSALGLARRWRRNRCDSRADSSGANTPDPTSLYNNQDNVFQTPNFNFSAGPSSPASPPATPNSTIVSDDSQPSLGNGSSFARSEKKKLNLKPATEEKESAIARTTIDFDEVLPFETRQFPLSDENYEEFVAEYDHNKEIDDVPSNTSSFPASPISSSSSTSTVEEDEDDEDDLTDPEWTVVKPMRNGPEQALVLKFAKR